MRLKFTLPFTLLIVMATIGFVSNWNPFSSDAPKTVRYKAPGSLRSLNTWSEARDYPFEQAPKDRYYQAWQTSQRFQKSSPRNKRNSAWQPMGPNNVGARTLALAVDPSNPNRMFAGSASGGLWVSETAGMGSQAWKRVPTGFPILGVAAIAINPTNSQEIYIGTGEVYGYTPTRPGIGNRLTRGSYGMGILKSEDGGKSWRLSLDWRYHQRRGIQDLEFSPDGDTLWAATTEGVWVSRDNGQSWSASLEVVMATSLSLNPARAGEMLVACGGFGSEGHGIYQSQDDGQSWQKMTQGVPAQFLGKAILDRAPSDPNIVYASIGNRNDVFSTDPSESITWLIRSADGGATWDIRNTVDYSAYQGWYSHFVKVSPNDPNDILVAGIVILTSQDGGLNFQQVEAVVSDGGSMTDFHAGILHPNQRFYMASDQGIFSSDDMLNFEPHHSGYQTTQFYRGTAQAPSNKDRLLGTPQDRLGVFYHGPDNWEVLNFGHEGGYTVFNPDDNDMFLVGAAHLLGLDGGGMDEVPADVPFMGDLIEDAFERTNFNAPIVLAPSNSKLVYAGRSVLYRSKDFGQSWTSRHDGEPLDGNPIGAIAVSYQDFNSLYIATSPRMGPMHVFRSFDGGDTLTDITAGLPERWPTAIVVDPRDEQTAYISFSGFGSSHLFRTRNNGQTWEDVDQGNLPDIPINSVFLDPDYPDHIYLANDVGILVSLNAGQTWLRFNEGLPEAVLAMDLVTYLPDRTVRLVTHGNGLYERQLLEPEDQPAAQKELLYPWVSYNEGIFESTLVANNLSQVPLDVTLTARRADGTEETVNRRIEPGAMLTERASSLFPELGSGSGYSVILRAPSQEIHGRWVTESLLAASGGSPSQGVAIAMPESGLAGDELWGEKLLFPYLPITTDFISAPVIVNLSNTPTDITLRFFDEAGQEIAQAVLPQVAPLLPTAALASQWIPEGFDHAMMTAESSGAPLAGVSFVFNDVFKETAIGNASAINPSQATPSQLIYPWVSNAANEFRSIVILNNLSDVAQEVSLIARREDGSEETALRTIPAGGYLAETSDALFPQLGSGPGYCVTVSGETDQLFGQWVTQNLRAASGGSPSLGVAIRNTDSAPSSRRSGQRILLGYLPSNQAQTAAPVLVNLANAPTQITLDFYGPDGQILFSDKTTLNQTTSLRPFARLVGDLLPQGPEAVYVIANSNDAPITGVAFVFNQGFFEPALGNAQSLE